PSAGSGLPSNRMRPESMGSSRLIVRHRVDLPPPEGPTMTRTSPRSMLRLTARRTCRSPKLLLTSSKARSVRAHPGPDGWAAVLLVMATPSPQPGNALAIRICRANKEYHLVAHGKFPMSLPYPMRTGHPVYAHALGYIVAAMLGRGQCRHDAVRMEKRWRKPQLIISRRDLSTTNNWYRSRLAELGRTERAGSLPRTTPRTGIIGRTDTMEPGCPHPA